MSTARASYQVMLERERQEQRRLAAAQERFRRVVAAAADLSKSIHRARSESGVGGVAAAVVPTIQRGTAAEYEKAARDVEKAVAEAGAAYDKALAAARAEAMVAPLVICHHPVADPSAKAAHQDRDARKAQRSASRGASPSVERPASDATSRQWSLVLEDRRSDIERLARRLPAGAGNEARAAVESAIQQALAAKDKVAYMAALDDLRMVTQQAIKRDQRRRTVLAQVEHLRSQLDGHEGDDVQAVRGRLAAVDPDRPIPGDLESAVAVAVSASQRRRDRGHALAALEEVLSELGYPVDQGFETAVVADGALVDLPGSTQHGVRVRERGGELLFNVVSYARPGEPADVVADQQAEKRFCGDYDRVEQGARERGVELTFTRRDPAGAGPLQHVTPSADRDRGSEGDITRVRERRA